MTDETARHTQDLAQWESEFSQALRCDNPHCNLQAAWALSAHADGKKPHRIQMRCQRCYDHLKIHMDHIFQQFGFITCGECSARFEGPDEYLKQEKLL